MGSSRKKEIKQGGFVFLSDESLFFTVYGFKLAMFDFFSRRSLFVFFAFVTAKKARWLDKQHACGTTSLYKYNITHYHCLFSVNQTKYDKTVSSTKHTFAGLEEDDEKFFNNS